MKFRAWVKEDKKTYNVLVLDFGNNLISLEGLDGYYGFNEVILIPITPSCANSSDIEKAIEFIKELMSENIDDVMYNDKIGRIILSALEARQESKGVDFDQLKNGWIPVKERLPTMEECRKNDCRFIVTDGNRSYQDWFDYENNYFDKCRCDGMGLKKDNCAIAWMPLPHPYDALEASIKRYLIRRHKRISGR